MFIIINLFGYRFTFWPTMPQDEKDSMLKKISKWIYVDDGILATQILFAVCIKIYKKKTFYMSINSAKPHVVCSVFDLQ